MNRQSRTVLGYLAMLAIFTGAHFAAERLVLSREVIAGNAAPVWLASAVALAIVFLFGYRFLPAIAIGAAAANLLTGVSLVAVAGATAGAVGEAALGVWILKRYGFRPSMERLRDAVLLVVVAAIPAAAVSATLGVSALAASDGLNGVPYPRLWGLWWFANLTSVVVAAPVILLSWTAIRKHRPPPDLAPMVVFLGLLAVAGALVFFQPSADPYVRPFLLLPIALIVTLRFGPLGAALSNAVLAILAIAGTFEGLGPFGESNALTSGSVAAGLIAAQVLIVTVSVTTLCVAAVVAERSTVRSRLEAADLRFRALVETIPAAIYIDVVEGSKGACLQTVYVSPQIEALTGYPPSAFMDDPELWYSLLDPDDREAAIESDTRHYGTGEPMRTQYRLRRRDGRMVVIRDEARLLPEFEGYREVSQGILLDVTAIVEARAQSDRLRARLIAAQEEERRRIAVDIHDDPLQRMTAVGLRLESIRRRLDGDAELAASLEELQISVEHAISQLRHLMTDLRPPDLDEHGLGAAIESFLFLQGADTPALFIDDDLSEPPSPAQRAVLYRIAQEAIRNVLRHADASRIDITLQYERGGIAMRIQDDGAGFDLDQPPSPEHIGLATMRERAAMAEGTCAIRSRPGHGTTIEFWIPDEATDSA